MQVKYTRHQVPRNSRPDAETFDKLYVIKNVSMLRATYQINFLALKAIEAHKKLVLVVPKSCQFHASLKELIHMNGKIIKREEI